MKSSLALVNPKAIKQASINVIADAIPHLRARLDGVTCTTLRSELLILLVNHLDEAYHVELTSAEERLLWVQLAVRQYNNALLSEERALLREIKVQALLVEEALDDAKASSKKLKGRQDQLNRLERQQTESIFAIVPEPGN